MAASPKECRRNISAAQLIRHHFIGPVLPHFFPSDPPGPALGLASALDTEEDGTAIFFLSAFGFLVSRFVLF
jgi:hypothetical protein